MKNRDFISSDVKGFFSWWKASFEEDGRSSGKSFTAFVFVCVVCIACMVAMIYSPNHILPSEMFFGLLGMITSMYGIKSVNRYMAIKNGNGSNPSGQQEAENIDESKMKNTSSDQQHKSS